MFEINLKAKGLRPLKFSLHKSNFKVKINNSNIPTLMFKQIFLIKNIESDLVLKNKFFQNNFHFRRKGKWDNDILLNDTKSKI
jgi:uncharacterized membrane protein